MRKLFYVLAFLPFLAQAQVGVGTATPDNSAMLEVSTTDKGILFPRLTTLQRTAIASPASGLYVFDTNTKSLWYFNGTIWVNTVSDATLGDVKSGFQSADHAGWIKLDGRLISTLTPAQQGVASSMGFSGNLPDATAAYLVQDDGTIGTTSGSNTTTLTQANLPNVNFTGTAASSGDHSHTGTTSSAGTHAHTINDPGHTHTQWTVNDDFNNSGGNPPGFTGDSAGSRTWANINASTTGISVNNNGNHNHTVNTTTDGAHTHTVSVGSGGTAAPVDISPKSLTVNMFVFLGQ
ncbi:MAG: hypothetical protein WC044_12485 [Crocinitomicaceae bacterium]